MPQEQSLGSAKPTVGIVAYGVGNIASLVHAVDRAGAEPVVAETRSQLDAVDQILLPGVGAFGWAARTLKETGLWHAVTEAADRGVPLLGICLGMQLLATSSDEGEVQQGLDLIPGHVSGLKRDVIEARVPHMGWNQVQADGDDVFFDVLHDQDMYFAHSYVFHTATAESTRGWATHGNARIPVVVRRGNVMGVQFHPEKSQSSGARFLERVFRGEPWH